MYAFCIEFSINKFDKYFYNYLNNLKYKKKNLLILNWFKYIYFCHLKKSIPIILIIYINIFIIFYIIFI